MIGRTRRLVTKLPLDELWSEGGDTRGGNYLGTANHQELAQLLRHGPVRFVVADIGQPLIWIDRDKCYDFWKSEVKPHIANPDGKIILSSFVAGYAYIARRWATELSDPVIVLEKHH